MGLLPESATVPLVIIGTGVALYLAAMAFTGRWLTEAAPFDLVAKTKGGVELRRYKACVIASVDVPDGDMRRAGTPGFRTIAGYIFGGNVARSSSGVTSASSPLVQQSGQASQKIAMTAPVVFEPQGKGQASQKIAMTAPVVFQPSGQSSSASGSGASGPRQGQVQGQEGHTRIAFVMPSKHTAGGAASMPVPLNSSIQLADVPERWEAVSTRRGRWPTQAESEAWWMETVQAATEAGWTPVTAAPGTGWNGYVVRQYAYDPPFVPDFLKKNEAAVQVEPPPQFA